MTPSEMKTELERQLTSGEATRDDYQTAVDRSEAEMAFMHARASYDVERYMMLEGAVNVYRDVLGLPKSTVSERARVPAGISDDEYRSRIANQLPESNRPTPKTGFAGELWQECEHRGCDTEPVCVNCFLCRKHCDC